MIKSSSSPNSSDTESLLTEIESFKKKLEDKGWIIEKTDAGLKALYKELEKVNTSLKTKVRERTEKLAEVNKSLKKELTERKQAEEELRKREQEFRTLVENAPDVISRFDREFRHIYINPAVEQESGMPPEFFIGKTNSEIGTPEYLAIQWQETIKSVFETGQETTVETNVPTPDGIRYYSNRIAPEFAEDGSVSSVLNITRNITSLKQAEQERECLILELALKNKELEQIVYVTSHDLRTPLVNVQGFSKELGYSANDLIGSLNTDDFPKDIKKKIKPILEKDIPESLKFIQGSISKMDSLLSALLRLSRLGRVALKMEKLDMNKTLEETSREHEFKLKETGTKLVIKKLPLCTGDKIQIDRLFLNIISNALKYLDPNRSGIIKITGKKQKEQSVYCVEDNGIGIAPEYYEKIFEIFHRLNPRKEKGEGLGLTIVRRILDRHNGKIWVESEVGKGSRFYVSLPAA